MILVEKCRYVIMGSISMDLKDGLTLEYVLREYSEIGKALSAQKDTSILLEMIVEKSMQLTSSDAGTIYIVVDSNTGKWCPTGSNSFDDRLLKFAITRNNSIDMKLEAEVSPITQGSIVGHTVLTGKVVRIDDVYNINCNDSFTFNPIYDNTSGYRSKSFLSVPMKDHEDNILGVIQLINKKRDYNIRLDFKSGDYANHILPYNYNDELIISSLAGQAAVALENSILYRNLHELLKDYKEQNIKLNELSERALRAHEEERKRIARDIHDGPAQSMANASFKVELCKKYIERDMLDNLKKELDALNQGVKSTVTDIRRIIYDLKPESLESGLINALSNHLAVFAESTGLNVEFYYEGDDTGIEYYISSTLFRITQETCSNIRKHAQAKNIKVELAIEKKGITLSVTDDGKGFNPRDTGKKYSSKIEGGFGIEGMNERMELIRGSLKIHSSPNKGTAICVFAPINHSIQ